MNPLFSSLLSRRSALLALCAAPLAGLAEPAPVPAVASPIAARAPVLGMAWAGPRAVAVGDQGVVLLSDDQGRQWRQAKSVPVSGLLTSVCFVDAQRGWAVGHGGAILATQDGGDTWALQRLALQEDRPLFSVHFFDAQRGVAVGLWSLLLTTDDGGKTWTEQRLSPPPGATKADANLLQLFADARGHLYAAGERGLVLASSDQGRQWRYQPTDFKGSLWCGLALADGSLLVGGLRGALYRSEDAGVHWQRVALDTTASLTALVAGASGEVMALGLDGLLAVSRDSGRRFELRNRSDRLGLTAALPTQGPADGWLLGSRRGVLAPR